MLKQLEGKDNTFEILTPLDTDWFLEERPFKSQISFDSAYLLLKILGDNIATVEDNETDF